MKKSLIITGGYINFERIKINPFDYDYIIAADSGYIAAQKIKVTPNVIVGDFDSAEFPDTDIETIVLPKEKDFTDTMLACNIAIERGATQLLIVGGTGGRADHFLSNVFMLEALKDRGVSAFLTDGENKISVLKDETTNIINNDMYFSLFPLDECNVTLSGCKYPLNNYSLTKESPSFAVSNEVFGKQASVKVIGKAILCESSK